MAYFSKGLGVRHQALSIYEKEMLAVLLAVRKWHAYLVGRHFKIRIEHQSLRFLSDQQAITPFQQKWVGKMLGYDYEIVYRKRSNNVAANSLFRNKSLLVSQIWQLNISTVVSELLNKVRALYSSDNLLQKLCEEVQQPSS